MQTTRTFIAIEVGPPASTVLSRYLADWSSVVKNVRWTRAEQMHVTLKFLGEVDNRDLPQICNATREICAAIDPFVATLNAFGTFPKGKPPRVLWAGFDHGVQEMVELNTRLESSLADIGIPRETRAFRPHLTLGRIGKAAQPEDILKMCESPLATQFQVDSVLMLASERERGNIIYEPIDTIEL